MKINNDIVEAALNAWFLPDEPQPYNEHYDEHIEKFMTLWLGKRHNWMMKLCKLIKRGENE
jgi:hypothetical protein